MMSEAELAFYNKLIDDQIYTLGDIYAIFYEYKTKQFSKSLMNIIADERFLVQAYEYAIKNKLSTKN